MTGSARYLRARDIVRELGITERTVRRWIADGRLPSVKPGGARLVAREDLERLLGESDPFIEEDEDNEQ